MKKWRLIFCSDFRLVFPELREGRTVELVNGDFLRISSINKDSLTGEDSFSGQLFRRTDELDDFFSPALNEVCLVEESILTNTLQQKDIPLGEVKRVRRLRMTVETQEAYNVRHTIQWPTSPTTIRREGLLFCRVKYVTVFDNEDQQRKANCVRSPCRERYITPLASAEIGVEESPMSNLRRSASSTTLVNEGGEVSDSLT